MEAEAEKELKGLIELLEEVTGDHSVPRNIRGIVEEALQKVSGENPKVENFSSAIYLLDDISTDINMPSHTRTDVWEIISKMEAIKEKIKE